jgi:nucleoside-diphosphate-sugar epimerase
MKILISGINGYFANILSGELLKSGHKLTGIDRKITNYNKNIEYFKYDLSKENLIDSPLRFRKFDILIDLAADIDFSVTSQDELYKNNIAIPMNLLEYCKLTGVKRYIYTSSNSVYLGNSGSFFSEGVPPMPIDEYGRSKFFAEEYLINNKENILVNILRCPNIIDAGRVGMLSILFDLLKYNATIWIVGDGSVRHQCLYAKDLCSAIKKLFFYNKSSIFNIGSDAVPTFKDLFIRLVAKSKSSSKIRGLPRFLVIPIMKFLYWLGLSPMGPYQFRMLTKEFIFDTNLIKNELSWCPTKNNIEMLELAYEHYLDEANVTSNSANGNPVSPGILSILKYVKI